MNSNKKLENAEQGLPKNGQSCYNVTDRTVRSRIMNNSFLSLPDDRRTSVINAALRVFPVWVQE